MKSLIGRNQEANQINSWLATNQPQFIAVYGRRRVGKTFLLRQTLSKQMNYFEITGKKNASLKEHMDIFAKAFAEYFYPGIEVKSPSSWQEALEKLTFEIEKKKGNSPIVLFFDELPWLSQRKSKCIETIEHFWNVRWSKNKRIKLFVCGSAATWMLDRVINSKGGLHNRLTGRIHLLPFNHAEVHEYLKSVNIKWSEQTELELQFIMQGIPFYLSLLKKNRTLSENISELLFKKDGLLIDEYQNLLKSLFDESEDHNKIIRALFQKHSGLTREEIIKISKLPSGGTLNKRINELIQSNFIEKFDVIGKNKKDTVYFLSDSFILFYLKWVEPNRNIIEKLNQDQFWTQLSNSPEKNIWQGYAFEVFCRSNVKSILKSLKLESITTKIGSYRKAKVCQIDLIIERKDKALHIIEIKWSNKPFEIDKNYGTILRNRIENLSKIFNKFDQFFLTIVSPKGIKANIWSEELVTSVVTYEDILRNT